MTANATRFLIQRAGVTDAARVAPLFDAYRQFYGAASDLAGAQAFITERLARAESVVLMALPLVNGSGPADDPVGFTQLYPTFSSVSLGPVLVLNDLYVQPAWRRSSVARSLVDEAARHGEREGAIRLHLSTQNTNAPALRLYHSLRFVIDDEFTHMSLSLPSGNA